MAAGLGSSLLATAPRYAYSHPHHGGALKKATAAASAAPVVAAPAERQTGQKRRAFSSPGVCLKLPALSGFALLHACTDAQGCDNDCAGGPPAAAASAPIATLEPSRSGRSRCLCSAHLGRACTCTPPRRVAHARSIDSIAAPTPTGCRQSAALRPRSARRCARAIGHAQPATACCSSTARAVVCCGIVRHEAVACEAE